jgi:hypothetical protein
MFFMALAFAATCAETKTDLRTLMTNRSGAGYAQVLDSQWVETTADDGKPLKIQITEQSGKLYFTFDKTQDGIWAEGPAQICDEDGKLVLSVTGKNIKLGKAAPWPVRWSMGGGTNLRLNFSTADKLHVSATGWSGDFVPQTSK